MAVLADPVADVAWSAAAAMVGYVLGSLSPANAVAHKFHADLHAAGSGNPGATNVGRLLGPRWGAVVALLDVAKGFVPAVLFGHILFGHNLFGHNLFGHVPAAALPGLVAGVAAVLGHVTSPLLHGRGGKGVATALGATLGVNPWWGLAVVAVFAVVVGLVRWVAVASVTAAVSLPVIVLVAGGSPVELGWSLLLAGIVLVRHRANFVRRWRGLRSR